MSALPNNTVFDTIKAYVVHKKCFIVFVNGYVFIEHREIIIGPVNQLIGTIIIAVVELMNNNLL